MGSARVGIGSDPSPNTTFSLLELLDIEGGEIIEISECSKMTDMQPPVGGLVSVRSPNFSMAKLP